MAKFGALTLSEALADDLNSFLSKTQEAVDEREATGIRLALYNGRLYDVTHALEDALALRDTWFERKRIASFLQGASDDLFAQTFRHQLNVAERIEKLSEEWELLHDAIRSYLLKTAPRGLYVED